MASRRSIISLIIEGKNLAGKALVQAKGQAADVTTGIASGFKKATGRISDAVFSIKGFVTALAGLAILRVTRDLFRFGSAAEETASKFRTVFGPAVQEVNQFIEENALLMGVTTTEAQDLLATTGAIAQGLGATREQSAALSTEIITLAGDLASFNNAQGGAEDVARRIQSALVGETESLKRLGIVLRQEDVVQRALIQTGKARADQLTQIEKAQASLALITERAGVAVGDLERTSSSAANTARRVTATFREMRDEIGKALLPMFAQLLGSIDENRGAIFFLSDAVKFLIQRFTFLVAEIRVFGADMARQAALVENSWELIKQATRLLVVEIREAFGDAVDAVAGRARLIAVTFTETWNGLADGAEIAAGAVVRALGGMVERSAKVLGVLGIDVTGLAEDLVDAGQGLIDRAIESQTESAREAAEARREIRDTLSDDSPDPELEAIRREAKLAIAGAKQARQIIEEEYALIQDEILASALPSDADSISVPTIDTPDVPGTDEAGDAIRKLREAGQKAQRDLDTLGIKASLLGDAFDPTAEKARILASAIEAATDAGLDATGVVPGLQKTLRDLRIEGESAGETVEGLRSQIDSLQDAVEAAEAGGLDVVPGLGPTVAETRARAEALREEQARTAERSRLLATALREAREAGLEAADVMPQYGRALSEVQDDADETARHLAGVTAALGEIETALDGAEGRADTEILPDLAPSVDAVRTQIARLETSLAAAEDRSDDLAAAIRRAEEAGLSNNDVVEGTGRTLQSLSAEYAEVRAEIESTEAAAKQFADDQRLVATLLASAKTPAEQYVDVVRQLAVAFEEGRITSEQFTAAMMAAEGRFKEGADALEKRAANLVRNVNTSVENALNDALVGLGTTIGQLMSGAGEGMQSLSDLVLGIVGSLMQTVGQALIAFGTAGLAIKSFIANPVAAIAAGVALVALGSALTASVTGSVDSAGAALAGGGGFAAGAAPGSGTAGAGIPSDLAAAGGGNVTLVIEGGLLDMSNPAHERSLAEALEDLSGRRVTVIRRGG